MKLIFTQGNPGSKYDLTRHNVGFFVAETLSSGASATFTTQTKFHADIAEFSHVGQKVIIAKPTTFYNETGRSFQAIKQFYKLENEDILVVHDELALPFGTIRTRLGGSDAGNNGIKSINMNGGEETARLRIGVGNDLRTRIGDTDFVLGRFSVEESSELTRTILPKCLEVIYKFIADDHQVTSHTLIDKKPEIL